MSNSILRVHPAIGLARVGNSDEYYLGPETIAALPQPGTEETGGLPIRPNTEHTTIRSSELRDASGRLKRQAARFRVFAYPEKDKGQWPSPGAVEIQIGSKLDGHTVTDMIWTVHLANKKAAWYQSPDDYGIKAYEQPALLGLTLRNLAIGQDPHNPQRLGRMIIDAGPRVVHGASAAPVSFDEQSTPAWEKNGKVEPLPAYPRSFPRRAFPASLLYEPQGAIDTLGSVHTDAQGRLIVLGGYGRAVGWYTGLVDAKSGKVPVADAVNNDRFYDDTSDGPVSCTVVLSDGSTREVHGAWVVATDPAYAPQTLNVVSLWDEALDTFIQKLDLCPEVFHNGRWSDTYKPSFAEHVQPIFKATEAQMWNAYLPPFAIRAHRTVGAIQASDNPDHTILAGLAYIRNPNRPAEAGTGAPLMPLALGDAGKAFLAPTVTQYYYLSQWAKKVYDPDGASSSLGSGEELDRAVLANCLGGRFSPGIDITFIIRETTLYITYWKQSGAGPFRVNPRPLDYAKANHPDGAPFLTFGWVPATAEAALGLEPGDICKFMALPWHADYNSCAIHHTSPNPLNSQTLYWSWPAQRPVTVYVAEDVHDGKLGQPRYSVRGPGTMPPSGGKGQGPDIAEAGAYADYNQMLVHWQDIGVIMQATNIDDGREANYRPHQYLEVQSRLSNGPPEMANPTPWPMVSGPGTAVKAP